MLVSKSKAQSFFDSEMLFHSFSYLFIKTINRFFIQPIIKIQTLYVFYTSWIISRYTTLSNSTTEYIIRHKAGRNVLHITELIYK